MPSKARKQLIIHWAANSTSLRRQHSARCCAIWVLRLPRRGRRPTCAYYQKAGFSSSNTYFKFNEDGTFNAKIDGKSWSGTYTFDEKTHAIDLKGRLLLSLNGFATKNTSGISILFESKKLLTIIQTLTALSGNTTLGTIGEISKNYDGIRVGFDLSK